MGSRSQNKRIDLEEIVARVRGGDVEAFGDIYHACFRPLRYMLLRQRIPRHLFEVEDVTQEVFFVAYRSIMNGTLREAAALPAFLRQTALHMCYQAIHSRTLKTTEKLPAGDFLCNDEPSALRRLEDHEERHARLTHGLAQLNELDREMLTRVLRGENAAQIMQGMRIDKTAYRLRKSRATAKLADAIRKRASKQDVEFGMRRAGDTMGRARFREVVTRSPIDSADSARAQRHDTIVNPLRPSAPDLSDSFHR